MKIRRLHPFDLDYREAVAAQESLREKLVLRDDADHPLSPKIIAGADISYGRNSRFFFAAVVLHSYPEMEIMESVWASEKVDFPYIPGLLTFREGPPLLKAFEKLHHVPDVVIFDGQGIAHPRGMGLASHLGLFLNIPAIGCAKTRLCGTYGEVGRKRGEQSPLIHEDRVIGSVLRTKDGVKPLFISQGHMISLERAVDTVLSCCRGYRLPEPIRSAHMAVNRLRQSFAAGKVIDG